jgi:hypothetical protein
MAHHTRPLPRRLQKKLDEPSFKDAERGLYVPKAEDDAVNPIFGVASDRHHETDPVTLAPVGRMLADGFDLMALSEGADGD